MAAILVKRIYLFYYTLCTYEGVRGTMPKVTFDVMSREYKAFWKENLAIYQKSLRALFQATLHIIILHVLSDKN